MLNTICEIISDVTCLFVKAKIYNNKTVPNFIIF